MILRFLLKSRQALFFSVLFLAFFISQPAKAMPVGTLLYRTSGAGKLYGYNSDDLFIIKNKIVRNIYTGHVGIYVGKENGQDYIVEAMPKGLIKVPANRFINTKNGEELIGAKIPKNMTEVQRLKVAQLAKTLAEKNLAYDFDFRKQKGPRSGEWTCVGLTEKIYESANTSNPFNLSSLEYDPRFYAINITPDGFDNYSIQNENGDCLSKDYEFSKISANKKSLAPLPELIGFGSGYEHNGERYFFFPLTQFYQDSLVDVEVDIELSSEFSDKEVRGTAPEVALVFKWSFINNPVSSAKKVFNKVASVFKKDKNKYTLLDKKEDQAVEEFLEKNKKLSELDKNSSDKNSTNKSKNKTEDKNENKNNTSLKKLKSLISIDSSQASSGNLNSASANNSKTNYNDANKQLNLKTDSNKSSAPSPSIIEAEIITQQTDKQAEISVNNLENFDILKKALLISQIYATLSDDYIEIYNPNNSDIDLEEAGVRLYKSKTSAKPTLMMRIGNLNDGTYPKGVVIPAKGKYLIARDSASIEIRNRANAIASKNTFSFTGKAYTIYLSGGVVSSDDDEDIIDKVGFGEATYFKVKPAVEILDNHLLFRKGNLNSNNNFLDFSLLNLSSENSDNQTNDNQDQNSQSENNINNQNNNNQNNNTQNSNQNNNNNQSDNQNNQNQNTNQSNNQDSQTEDLLPILISRVYATGKDDYIELYNPNEVDINLEDSAHRLYKTKTGAKPYLMLRFGNLDDASYPGGLVIKAKGKYLIARADASQEILDKAQAIVNRKEFTFTGDAYTIYLADGVVSSDDDEDIVDKLGFGGANYFRIAPAPEILDNHLLIRKAQADSTAISMAENCDHYYLGNGFDSQNNSFDFVLLDLSQLQGDYCHPNQENNQDQDDNSNDEQSDNQDELNNYIYNYCLDGGLPTDDLINLWHFNECQGDLAYDFAGDNHIDNLDVSWILEENNNCAISHKQGQRNINTKLSELFDSNNFTLIFRYKILYENSRPVIRFTNSSNNSYFQIQLSGSYTEIENLPNIFHFPPRLKDLKWPVGNDWHQFAVVINKPLNYWALYNDGQEVLRKEIGPEFINEADGLSLISTGNQVFFDEISVFKKALKPVEISRLHQKNLPFNPLNCQQRRFKELQSAFYFNFDDNYFENLANNRINIYDFNDNNLRAELEINKDSLINDGNNIYLNIEPETEININSFVSKIKDKPDLSLSLWLKREELNNALSSFGLKILSDNKNVFGINLANSFFYYFNDLVCQIDDDLSNLALNDDGWHYLVLVYDYYNFELNLYIDGSLKKTLSRDWLNYELIDKIVLFSEGASSYIDEINLFQGVADISDISSLYLSKKDLFK